MPFSFIEIEESKSRVILLLFLCVVIFYFFTAYLVLFVLENSLFFYFNESEKFTPFFPPLNHTLVTLSVTFVIGLFHWALSTSRLIEKMSLVIGAMPVDDKDTYHQYFKNIVDEVSVAIGGRHIEAMVIRSSGVNAFSLVDFDRRAVIGVTEGLLSRLSRPQIEAVVAHETGHIASGDSLTTTITSCLSEIYEETIYKIKAGLRETSGRGTLWLILIFVVLSFMHFLSGMLRCFLSREREYRTDAIAVRLTRNPLSLAEALKLISKNWHGCGTEGEKLESIFIVNPKFNKLDEEETAIANLFSTHPPIKKRIEVLLNMAHLDEKTLEENLKNFTRVSPVAKVEFKPDTYPTESKRWLIFSDNGWIGPFSLSELTKLEGLRPDQWVKLEGRNKLMAAYEDKDLHRLFLKDEETKECLCPNCQTSLSQINYEGVPILKCYYCEGVFVENDRISRILIRKDYVPSDEIKRLTEVIIDSKKKIRLEKVDPKSVWVINCPNCKRQMRRQFFVYSYPIEIDRCIGCGGVWFDKQELEILQHIYENYDKFLYAEGGF